VQLKLIITSHHKLCGEDYQQTDRRLLEIMKRITPFTKDYELGTLDITQEERETLLRELQSQTIRTEDKVGLSD